VNKALFLDRDGVINVDHGYLYKAEDVEFVEGIFELCRRFRDTGYMLVVVTNQSGIGRGYYTETDFHALSQWMKEQFAEQGCHIEKFYFCPHHASKAKGEYLQDCDCRKPKPGMLLQAAKELDIDLGQSVFIGDKYSDMQAGNSAEIGRCVLLESSYLQAERGQNPALTQLDFKLAATLNDIEPE
jgi:D-glycero-D-manno-heptose 1,7-bisphosphate phosphatase